MAPPEPLSASIPGQAGQVPAVPSFAQTSVLKKRRDFLAAARARRQAMPAFVVQGRQRSETEPSATPVRIGYTCSKKVGNAVARNRAKRRLREIANEVLPTYARPGWDYVLIGRHGTTASRPLPDMAADLIAALDRIHAK